MVAGRSMASIGFRTFADFLNSPKVFCLRRVNHGNSRNTHPRILIGWAISYRFFRPAGGFPRKDLLYNEQNVGLPRNSVLRIAGRISLYKPTSRPTI